MASACAVPGTLPCTFTTPLHEAKAFIHKTQVPAKAVYKTSLYAKTLNKAAATAIDKASKLSGFIFCDFYKTIRERRTV